MKSERTLVRWGLVMVGDHGPILAGSEGGGVYRSSTPLVEFDAEAGKGVTASGRPYRVFGHEDKDYARWVVQTLWGIAGANARIVSPEDAAAIIASRGNAPFRRTPQEQSHLDGLKLRHIATEFGVQMICLGIDEVEAAAICGLTEDRIRGILDCNLSRVSVEEADAAFVTLAQAASNKMGM
jgi:hypothetical protein